MNAVSFTQSFDACVGHALQYYDVTLWCDVPDRAQPINFKETRIPAADEKRAVEIAKGKARLYFNGLPFSAMKVGNVEES